MDEMLRVDGFGCWQRARMWRIKRLPE